MAKKHSKESIIQALKNLANRLGKDTLSQKDVSANMARDLPLSSINSHFGSFGAALRAAGLKVQDPRERLRDRGICLSDDKLFNSFLTLERRIGHIPGYNEYQASGEYSVKPFKKRFGKWSDVVQLYKKWKADQPDTAISGSGVAPIRVDAQNSTRVIPQVHGKTRPAVLYGEPIDFRGLRNAPTNEMGVVYLFAMVSRELGFMINAIGSAFPDCEGTFLYDAKQNQWAEAKIEFEFVASNFKSHGHDPNQCNFIVCWKNDWPDCPVTIIELSKEILKLPSR